MCPNPNMYALTHRHAASLANAPSPLRSARCSKCNHTSPLSAVLSPRDLDFIIAAFATHIDAMRAAAAGAPYQEVE